jgi:hypothetical protein
LRGSLGLETINGATSCRPDFQLRHWRHPPVAPASSVPQANAALMSQLVGGL